LENIEDRGTIEGADPEVISDRAFTRGKDQLGTLGSGNHFLEIGFIEEIFDEATAAQWGLWEGQVTTMIHSGSRGFGHQTCDDFLARMVKSVRKEGLELPDTQLACTRLNTALAKEYLAAMAAAANYAFANRQVLMHLARTAWEESLGLSPRELQFRLLYDVCHNIAKVEKHTIDGETKKVCVHRKGATRAFPAHHPILPVKFRSTGQPVLIPGDMGRASYVLAGEQGSMAETFGSACHGAGRLLSRSAALKLTKGRAVERELQDNDVFPRWVGRKTLREEVPEAYKDVSLVVDVVQRAGLARKVAKIRPMGVVKG
jgi:tRNA-splicing ligase RtcB